MVLNITGVDNQLYYDTIIALNVCFFIFLSLLPLLLCALVLLALETINIKIRVLLINVIAVEILGWLCYALVYLGWIVRLNYNETTSCKLFFIAYNMVNLLKSSSGTLYTINIFLFIKYGEKKLKWSVIIPYIAISWVMISIVSIIIVLVLPSDSVQYSSFGSCFLNTASSPLITIILVLLISQSFVFMIVQIVMAIVTCVYIKKHTLEGNAQIKKAVARVLVYIVTVSINTSISTIIPPLSFLIWRQFPGSTTVVTVTARNYIDSLITSVPNIATPIIAIVLLKPVRDAIKKMSTMLFCKKDNRIHPAMDSNDIELT